jgi:hypothetical protein
VAFGGLLTTACAAVSCTTVAISAFRVSVLDAAGNSVCNAKIVVREGDFASELTALNCVYFGAHERAGTYSLEVTVGSDFKSVDGIKVSKDECHVVTRELTVTMDH